MVEETLAGEKLVTERLVPVALVKVVLARVVTPVTPRVPPIISLPELFTKVAEIPARVEVPVIVVLAAESKPERYRLLLPVALVKVRAPRVARPVTFKVPAICSLPELARKVAETPARVEVPEILVVAAEMPEVTAS